MGSSPESEGMVVGELDKLEACIDQAMMAIDQALMAITAAHQHALALAEAGQKEAARSILEKLRSAMETWLLLMELLEERLELDTALKAPGQVSISCRGVRAQNHYTPAPPRIPAGEDSAEDGSEVMK